MRIHTSATEDKIRSIVREVPGVFLHSLSEHRSRTHPRALEVRLEGTGGRSNTGLYGAGDFSGATWDEWGAVLGGIFRVDPEARMGGSLSHPVYANAEDYAWQTGHRFDAAGIPADSHPRHQWKHDGDSATGSYAVHRCSRCSALRRYSRHGWEAVA